MSSNEPWSIWAPCQRGTRCVGWDRYPEAVEHRLTHNRKGDAWYYICQSCGETNGLFMTQARRELLRRLSHWRETLDIVEQAGLARQEAML